MNYRILLLLILFYLTATLAPLAANPIDPTPTVVTGQVDFIGLDTQSVIINQATEKAIVDCSCFNIPEGGSVVFNQLNSNAAILIRITGADHSLLNGTLTANGHVFFVNPAGVTFGANSVIRADVFMAAAGQMSNGDFCNNIQNFSLTGNVENLGSIQTENQVGLFGQQVLNNGEIVSNNGHAIVASGDEVHVRQGGTGLIVEVTDPAMSSRSGTGIKNLGTVDGEEVMFSAGDAFATAIQQSGTVKASKSAKILSDGGVVEVSGEITARNGTGQGGRIEVGGTDMGGTTAPTSSSTSIFESAELDASSDSGKGGHVVVWSDGHTDFEGQADASSNAGQGGHIEVSGKTFSYDSFVEQLRLGAGGHFLLDPTDLTIDATTASGIEEILDGGTDVSLATNALGLDAGDITVKASIQVPINNIRNKGALTLTADRDITVDSGVVIENLQEDFAPGQLVFDFQAGRDINLSGDVLHSGIAGVTGRGTIQMTADGDLNLNNVSIDGNGGSVILSANDITLNGLRSSIVTGLNGENTGLIDLTATGALTFAGGSIQTYGGADVLINANLFTNNTGASAISRFDLSESFFGIRLPNPTDNGTGTNHIYGGLQSGSSALFNVKDPIVTNLLVGDYSFENNSLNPGGWGNNLSPEWQDRDGENDGGSFEEYIDGFVDKGTDHVGMATGYYIWQDTGIAIAANTTYTLTVAAGNRNATHTTEENASIYGLLGGATGLGPQGYANTAAVLNSSLILASGSVDASTFNASLFADGVPLVYTTGATVPSENLVILLGDNSPSGRSHFDNIRLDAVAAVPDPSSMLLDWATIKSDGITKNHYYYHVQPVVKITANNGTKNYGDTFNLLTGGPAVTVNTGNFVQVPPGNPFLQDTTANALDLTGVTTSSDGASIFAGVRNIGYDISAEGAESNNGYLIEYQTGDLTVNRRAITLTANEQEKTYGDQLALDDTVFTTLDKDGDAELPNGEVVTNVTINSATGVDDSTTSDVATYADETEISGPVVGTNGTGDGFLESNYDITYVAGDLTVNRRAAQIIASAQEKDYGDVHDLGDTAFTVVDRDGGALPNGETVNTVTLVSENRIDASTNADVGTYTDNISVTPTSTSDPTITGSANFNQENYTISYGTGDLTVNRRAITLTANAQEKDYGDVHDLGDTAFTTLDKDGDAVLPNGETVFTVTLVDENGIDASTDADVGTYTDNISVTPTITGSANFNQENYTISYGTGDLTVNRRAITLTANEQEKTYGDQLALDDTAFTTLDKDGDAVLPNGEVVTNVSINSATGVGASTTSPVATYADEIVISGPVAGTDGSGDGFLESNYDITYISGDLVIKPYQIIKVEILKDNLNAVYLRVKSMLDVSYTIEVSEDLESWTQLKGFQGTGDIVEITEIAVGRKKTQYYRIKTAE